jgi:hypothetical protein
LSSILDSLKKLEKETAQQENLQAIAGVETKAAASKRIITLIGILCLCVVAFGAMVHYQGFSNNVTESPPEKAAPTAKPATPQDNIEKQPTPSQDSPAPLPAAPVESTTTAVAAVPEVEASDQISAQKPIPEKEVAPRQNTVQDSEGAAAVEELSKEAQGQEKSLPGPEPQVQTAKADTLDSPADVSPEEPVKKNEPLQIERLEGVSFKIQAISWSETPEQSLAVVNSQVLREGDTIEGYHIRQINPDDIILNRGGKAYRLDFRSTGSP